MLQTIGVTVAFMACVVLAACILFGVTELIMSLVNRIQEKRRDANWRAYLKLVDERNAPWLAKLEAAKHLLTGPDWKSADGKKEFVEAVCGEGVPMYQWYWVGSADLSELDMSIVIGRFWRCGRPDFGDIERHGHGQKLRIRGAERFCAELVFGEDRKLPLCQVGYSQFGDTEQGCISFPELKPECERAQV